MGFWFEDGLLGSQEWWGEYPPQERTDYVASTENAVAG